MKRMFLTDPVLKKLKKLSFKTSYIWFWVSLIVWMLGVGGSDLYALPSLIGIVLLFRELIINEKPLSFFSASFNHSIVKFFYVLLVLIVLARTLLSLYSFRWNIYDVGSYSSVVFNFSKGLNFNSFLQIPSTSDHFTISLAVFAPLYWIVATAHWLTLAKALSYLSVPLVVFFWLKNKTDNNYRFLISFLFGLWMLMLYKPAVRSSFFEFSPSSLALPFIILSFLLMQKNRWFLFTIIMLFLLGLKEHMGVILVGFGLFLIAQRNYRTGFVLTSFGLLITYLMMFHFMPYFRDYETNTNSITQITPFQDIYGKCLYLFKLLCPLGFLPLIFWRYGILSTPAIAVNLLSHRQDMYSSFFHHDDVSSTLLLMSCSLILIEKRSILAEWLGRKWLKGIFIIWIVGVLAQLPASPIRMLRYAVPNSTHLNLLEDIRSFDKSHPNESLAVQSSIGPHIHRHNITNMTQQHTGECSPPKIYGTPVKYILLSPHVGYFMINDIEKCIKFLEDHPKYIRKNNFQYLVVYERSTT